MTYRFLTLLILAAAVVAVFDPDLAHAAETNTDMPWNTPLQNIAAALTGKVAYWLTLLGVFVAGAVLVFGGEINQFVRSLAMLILVGSVMAGATAVMSTIFTQTAVIL
jgi:type IV secretion system protein VirB2